MQCRSSVHVSKIERSTQVLFKFRVWLGEEDELELLDLLWSAELDKTYPLCTMEWDYRAA